MQDPQRVIPILFYWIVSFIATGCGSEEIEPSPPPPAVPQSPAITSIEPDQGKFGDEVVISGLNFGGSIAENRVTFNGIDAVITDASPTRLLVEVPKGAGSGTIAVSTDIGAASSPGFTYLLRAIVETVAGTGTAGFKDGSGVQAQFNSPNALFLHSDGTLLIADGQNEAVRRLTNGVTSTVLTIPKHQVWDVYMYQRDAISHLYFATTPNTGGLIFQGIVWVALDVDNYAGYCQLSSRFVPGGITIPDSDQVEFYVTDRSNQVIKAVTKRKLDKFDVTGTSSVAGNVDGSGIDVVRLNNPTYLRWMSTSRGDDRLYFSDQGNHSVRVSEIRTITNNGNPTFTLAGNGQRGFADGVSDQAQFNEPRGIDLDEEGNIYVADFGNNAIRKITPAGEVTTLLKSEGEVSSSADPMLIDGPEGVARLNGPFGIAVAPDGSLYVSDFYHHAIRRITFE